MTDATQLFFWFELFLQGLVVQRELWFLECIVGLGICFGVGAASNTHSKAAHKNE